MNWTNLIAYAFPPFNLIPAVLHKTKKEMATLILIAPLWSAQPWVASVDRLSNRLPCLPGEQFKSPDRRIPPKDNPSSIPGSKNWPCGEYPETFRNSRPFYNSYQPAHQKALRPQPPRHITVPGLSGVAGVKNGRVIPYLLQSPRS